MRRPPFSLVVTLQQWSIVSWRTTAFLLLALLPLFTHAARFQSFEEQRGSVPRNSQDIQGEINRLEQHIENNVSCGGWLEFEELEQGSQDLLTTVAGAPGRSGNPTGAIATSMAERGGFTYPAEAAGYMSACHIQDPECNPGDLCLLGQGTATPLECRELYHQLLDLKNSRPEPERICGIRIPTKFDFTETCTGAKCRCGVKRTCVDFGGGLSCSDVPNQPNAEGVCDPGFIIPQYPYCVFDGAGNLIITSPLIVEATIAPFYRHYGPVSSPEAIPEERYAQGILVSSEEKEQRVAADCYEYYIERDALTNKIPDWQHRCELYETDDSDSDKNSPEWPDEEYQMGAVRPNLDVFPYRAEDTPEPGERDILAPWVADEKTSMALLSLQLDQPPDSRSVNPDDLAPSLPATPQSVVTASRTSGTARTDPIDDATNRSATESRMISEWWETQQRNLQTIMKQPVIRVLLPARFGTGLSSDDPLVAFLDGSKPVSSGIVERTLRAGDDEIGSVIAALEQSLLLVPQERPVSVLVPMQSELELDALIHDWRMWEIQFNREGDADDIIQKLESYKEQVRRVRLLRIGIASSLTHMLEAQQDIRGFFAAWYVKNAQNLETWTRDTQERRKVQEEWEKVMNTLITIHDGCELKWCSNARFSIPVYSLLDEWMPGRPSLTALSTNPDYHIPAWDPPEDWVIDFSQLSLPRELFYVPSLAVTQVRLRLPDPPEGNYALPSANEFPDIPLLPLEELDPFTLFDDTVPSADVELPSLSPSQHYVPSVPEEKEYEPIITTLGRINTLFESARGKYCAFRDSIAGRNNPGRKIVHTEFDLRERIARLFARRAPMRSEDYEARVVRKGEPEAECGDDTICEERGPERSLSFKWLVSVPEDNPVRFHTLAERLRELLLPGQPGNENPYYDATLRNLERIFTPPLTETPGRPLDTIDLSVPSS